MEVVGRGGGRVAGIGRGPSGNGRRGEGDTWSGQTPRLGKERGTRRGKKAQVCLPRFRGLNMGEGGCMGVDWLFALHKG